VGMEEKFCSDCGCNRPIVEFCFKNVSKGIRQAYCNVHRRHREKLRYQRIKHSIISKVRDRAEVNKQCIKIWKTQFVCVLCGENEPCCIDFHHTNHKTLSISAMVHKAYPIEAIIKELQKCIVMCSNCHRKEHHSESQISDKHLSGIGTENIPVHLL